MLAITVIDTACLNRSAFRQYWLFPCELMTGVKTVSFADQTTRSDVTKHQVLSKQTVDCCCLADPNSSVHSSRNLTAHSKDVQRGVDAGDFLCAESHRATACRYYRQLAKNLSNHNTFKYERP